MGDTARSAGEWLTLAAVVDEIGAVPYRTSDPEAWWPDRREMDEPPARIARDAGSVCDVKAACLANALAADEREAIWAGLTPQERESLPRVPAEAPGVRTSPDPRRAHARRVAEGRKRRQYGETTKAS